jgi:hypothetical protein
MHNRCDGLTYHVGSSLEYHDPRDDTGKQTGNRSSA